MQPEGHLKVAFRRGLSAISDRAGAGHYDGLVAQATERGKGLNAGVSFAFDEVTD